MRLGGRAAELVEFGQGSTGASNDLAGATDLAAKMVREFGLSLKLGRSDTRERSGVPQRRRARDVQPALRGGHQAAIDRKVARLLREAEQTAVELIRSHRPELDQFVALLLEHETVAARRCTG